MAEGCNRDENGSHVEGISRKLWGALRRNLTATAACSTFILEEVLAPSDADPSAGFSLHIADILVQELISACEDSPVPAPALQVRSEFSRGSARAHEVLIVARQASLLPVLGVWHGNDVQRGGRGEHGGLNHGAPDQALLEPWCNSLAHTKRAALLSRLQDGVFEPLLEGRQYGALANLDTQQLATCLFDLGMLAPCLLPEHLHISPIWSAGEERY